MSTWTSLPPREPSKGDTVLYTTDTPERRGIGSPLLPASRSAGRNQRAGFGSTYLGAVPRSLAGFNGSRTRMSRSPSVSAPRRQEPTGSALPSLRSRKRTSGSSSARSNLAGFLEPPLGDVACKGTECASSGTPSSSAQGRAAGNASGKQGQEAGSHAPASRGVRASMAKRAIPEPLPCSRISTARPRASAERSGSMAASRSSN